MAGNEEKSVLSLRVTELQRETIMALYNHHDWTFDEIELPEVNVSQEDQAAYQMNFQIQQDAGRDECPYCLCRPCITDESNRQLWWPTEWVN